MIKKICRQCGKEFEAEPYPRSGGITRVTCSKECQYILTSLNNPRRNAILINCKTCGKSFYSPPNRIKSNAKYCSMKCFGIGKRGSIPWNKRDSGELKNIREVLEKYLSIKMAVKILNITPAALGTLNYKYFKINCHKGWAKYPRWTKKEDDFAMSFLKENPDLHLLAKEIAKRRNIIFTERFWHHIRNRSSEVWKMNLKKLRAEKKFNLTMFKKGLCPWNKGRPVSPEMLDKITKQRKEQWNNERIVENFFRGQFLKGIRIKEIDPLSEKIIQGKILLFKIRRFLNGRQ